MEFYSRSKSGGAISRAAENRLADQLFLSSGDYKEDSDWSQSQAEKGNKSTQPRQLADSPESMDFDKRPHGSSHETGETHWQTAESKSYELLSDDKDGTQCSKTTGCSKDGSSNKELKSGSSDESGGSTTFSCMDKLSAGPIGNYPQSKSLLPAGLSTPFKLSQASSALARKLSISKSKKGSHT